MVHALPEDYQMTRGTDEDFNDGETNDQEGSSVVRDQGASKGHETKTDGQEGGKRWLCISEEKWTLSLYEQSRLLSYLLV